MKSILTAPFLTELVDTASNMYRLGFDERNGGNISMLLEDEEVLPYLYGTRPIRKLPLSFDAAPLADRYFLVTGASKYFKNLAGHEERDLGLIKIASDGHSADLMWGFSDGGTCTSELPAHLMSHMARLDVAKDQRVVTHCHPTKLLAMNRIFPLDEAKLTHMLWQMCSECIIVFPEGIGVLPWMLCGTDEIGRATADKLREFRVAVWGLHGIYAAGSTLDETFGLIETIEKAAELYMLTCHMPILNTITDDQLRQLAYAYHVDGSARFDFLEE